MENRNKTLRSIRNHFSNWGFDISGLSDDELEKSVVNGGKRVASLGFTMEEASKSLNDSFRPLN